MKKLIILLLVFISFSGCRSSRNFSEKSVKTTTDTVIKVEKIYDTVFKDRIVEKIKPVYSEITIEEPCDEDGNLKPFNQSIGSGGNTSGVYVKDGKLYISQKLDSAQNTWEKEYRSQWKQDSIFLRNSLISKQESTEKIKVYVYPWWLWLVMILGGFFGLLWLVEKFDILTRLRRLIIKV